MTRHRKLLILLTCLVLAVVVGVGIYLIASTDISTISGQMYGYVVTEDGEVLQTIQFTLDAKLTEPVIGKANLKLRISDFPQDMDDRPYDDYDSYHPIPTNTPKTFFSFSYYYGSTATQAALEEIGAVDMEDGTLILRSGSRDSYIIVSKDANADPQALFESFALFTKLYALG